MQILAQSSFRSVALLLAISVGSLFLRLGYLPLSGADEPRYARIAEEMYARNGWTTPTLEGKPWLEKPPLYYWITIPLLSFFESRETAARFGPALCALATALSIYWLGSVLWTRLAGLLGASMLLTSLGFAGFGRSASTDMPFTCFLTLALAVLAAAVRKDIGTIRVLPAYVFLGFAILGKGPVALVLAGGVAVCCWFLDDRSVLLSRWRPLRGLVVTVAVSIPWFWLAFRQNGYAFISVFFLNHNIARYVTGIHHHSQPIYYFLPILLALFFPWSGWIPYLISNSPIKELRRWRQWDPCMVFLHCWFLFPIIFFSFSDSKLSGYILPSLPPLALILGVRLSRTIEKPVISTNLRTSACFSLVISITMAVGAPLYFHKGYGNWQTGLFLSVVIIIPLLPTLLFGLSGRCLKACVSTLAQGLLVIIAIAYVAFPVLGAYLSARDAAQSALKMQKPGEPIVAYALFDHSLDYYSGYRVIHTGIDPESVRDCAQKYGQVLVVVEETRMKEILSLKGCSVSHLGRHGNFRLLRISRK